MLTVDLRVKILPYGAATRTVGRVPAAWYSVYREAMCITIHVPVWCGKEPLTHSSNSTKLGVR